MVKFVIGLILLFALYLMISAYRESRKERKIREKRESILNSKEEILADLDVESKALNLDEAIIDQRKRLKSRKEKLDKKVNVE